jgi:hypothetical protein
MDNKQSLGHQFGAVVAGASRSRRASRWLGLAVLGALALTFRHVLPIRSLGPDDTTDDPRNMWEEVCMLARANMRDRSCIGIGRSFPAPVCRGPRAMMGWSAPSSL